MFSYPQANPIGNHFAYYDFMPNKQCLQQVFKASDNNVIFNLYFQQDSKLFLNCDVYFHYFSTTHGEKEYTFQLNEQYYTIQEYTDWLIKSLNITEDGLVFTLNEDKLQNDSILEIALTSTGDMDLGSAHTLTFTGNHQLRALGLVDDQLQSQANYNAVLPVTAVRPFYMKVYKEINVELSIQDFIIYDTNNQPRHLIASYINNINQGDYYMIQQNFNINLLDLQDLQEFQVKLFDELFQPINLCSSVKLFMQQKEKIPTEYNLVKIR